MSDEEAIRDVIARWMAATKSHDDSVLDLMTDDVVFLTAGRQPFGKEVFRVAFAALQGMTIDGQQQVEELQVMGDHAYVRTHLVVTATMPDGKVVVRSGAGLAIFRKENGRWRLARDANLLEPP